MLEGHLGSWEACFSVPPSCPPEGTLEPPTSPGLFLEASTFQILGLPPLKEQATRPLEVPLRSCPPVGLFSGRESQSWGRSRLPQLLLFQVPGTVPGT